MKHDVERLNTAIELMKEESNKEKIYTLVDSTGAIMMQAVISGEQGSEIFGSSLDKLQGFGREQHMLTDKKVVMSSSAKLRKTLTDSSKANILTLASNKGQISIYSSKPQYLKDMAISLSKDMSETKNNSVYIHAAAVVNGEFVDGLDLSGNIPTPISMHTGDIENYDINNDKEREFDSYVRDVVKKGADRNYARLLGYTIAANIDKAMTKKESSKDMSMEA